MALAGRRIRHKACDVDGELDHEILALREVVIPEKTRGRRIVF
jgi:hypothetical protein